MASKMKAALEQRSAVMDGKVLVVGGSQERSVLKSNHGRRKTEWAQEGGKEGGGQDQQHHSRGAFI